MSSQLLTLGLGTFGNVKYLPTLGLGTGAEAPPVEPEVVPIPPRGGGGMPMHTIRKRRAGLPDEELRKWAQILKDDQDLIAILPVVMAAIEKDRMQ